MKSYYGVLAIVLAAVLYGLYGVFSRLIGVEFGTFAANYTRSLFQLVFFALYYLIFRNQFKQFARKDYGWLFLWSLFASIPMFTSFVVFNHLAIGTSYLLIYATMIMGGILVGKVLFNELLDYVKVASIALCLIGLFIVFSGGLDVSTSALMIGLALASGLMVGIWNALSKKLSGNYPPLQLVAVNSIAIFIVGVLGALIFYEPIPNSATTSQWFWVFVYALTQIITIYLIVYGFKILEAQKASLILPVEIVFAALFGYVFFQESLNAPLYIGGLLIILAAALPNFYQKKFVTSKN